MAIADEFLEDRSWAFTAGVFRALGFTFELRATDEAVGGYLARVLRPLRTHEPAEHVYSVIDHGAETSPRYGVYFDDETVMTTESPLQQFMIVLWHVNQRASTRSSRYIVFHASAAEHAGRGMIFPASMESGKSTLVTALVRHGFGYLTDEAVALDPASGLIVPYPRSLSLDEGSWPLFPDLKPAPEPGVEYSRAQWQIDPDVLRPGACADPCPPSLIITPRYQKGAETTLEPLRRAEAILVLVENSFNFHDQAAHALPVLARVVAQCRCYRLVMGNLDEACRLVAGVARELGGPPAVLRKGRKVTW